MKKRRSMFDMVKRKPKKTKPEKKGKGAGKPKKYRSDTVFVPVADIQESGDEFREALESPIHEQDVGLMLMNSMRNNVAIADFLNQTLLDTFYKRVEELLEGVEGDELLFRCNKLAHISARASKSIIEFKELELIIDAIKKLKGREDGAEEEDVITISEGNKTIIDQVKKDPAAMYRALSLVNYIGRRKALTEEPPVES